MYVTLHVSCSFEKQKSFEVPTPVYSACLHNSKDFFVAGGEDFKLYKFSYADGSELGKTEEK